MSYPYLDAPCQQCGKQIWTGHRACGSCGKDVESGWLATIGFCIVGMFAVLTMLPVVIVRNLWQGMFR